jgi:iron complex transport system permease protein
VLAASGLASFRVPFASDLVTLLLVNGPRVLLGAGVGGALALAGALRQAGGGERPLRELEILALSAGGAGGGFWLARGLSGAAGLLAFAAGAAAGAALFGFAARLLERPRRWTNLAAALLLAALAAIAALAGTYARERGDLVAAAVAWLLGDLSGASFASGAAVLGIVVLLAAAALRAAAPGAPAVETRDGPVSPPTLSLVAFGLGVGVAGPLAFVGGMVPRTVRWLAAGASPRALLAASTVAGAATVVAIDAVPRLLLGGYQFGFNVYAAMLAVPIFLGWNRRRLRGLAGPARARFEVLEVALIAGLTLLGVWLAVLLTGVIRSAT